MRDLQRSFALPLGICSLLLFEVDSSHATTRRVAFSGVAASMTYQDETTNRARSGECIVTVTNAGDSAQDVLGIKFFVYDGLSKKMVAVGPMSSDRYSVGSVASDCGTTQNAAFEFTAGNFKTLAPGDTCSFGITLDAVTSHSQQLICTGSLLVADSDVAKGSGLMVASGAILSSQESILLGGVLSGAYYASGAHLNDTSNLHPAPAGFSFSTDVQNMNAFCPAACLKAGLTDDYCKTNCGSSIGMDTGDNEGSTGFRYFSFGVTGQIFAAPDDSFVALDSERGVVQKSSSTISGAAVQPASTFMRNGNAHFAGGNVYEMIMGPMVSICTANQAAWDRGAIEFTHAGGIDGHAVILGSGTAGGGPPERLVCNHRHAMEDLYFGVGQSQPLVINGGQGF